MIPFLVKVTYDGTHNHEVTKLFVKVYAMYQTDIFNDS